MALVDGVLNAPQAADAVDGAEVVLVAFVDRAAVRHGNAQAGVEERLLDVVRGEGVACEEHVDVAGS